MAARNHDISGFHLSSPRPTPVMQPMQTGIIVQIFTPVGLISGVLFVVAVGCSFVAISLLGSVGTATGIWCGIAMCTSYFSGILTGESLNQYLSTFALVVMIFSVYRLSETTKLSRCASSELAKPLDRKCCERAFRQISPCPYSDTGFDIK